MLKASPFLGEGHRKVKARLAAWGIRAGKNRVLRLMREHGLLAPVRRGRPRGDRSHSGRIRTERPDELWGTDAARFWTKAEGWCWFFAAIDHCASVVVGWHVAKKGDRWAALEPIRQGLRAPMGGFGKSIALGLGLRHDWGSQYRARQFQAEIKWLGIRSTPRLRGRTGVQRCRGALHPHAQGGVHLSAPLRYPRGGQSSDRGFHRALQQRLAPPAPRVHDPGPRPREAQPKGGLMFKPSTCPENPDRYRLMVSGMNSVVPSQTGERGRGPVGSVGPGFASRGTVDFLVVRRRLVVEGRVEPADVVGAFDEWRQAPRCRGPEGRPSAILHVRATSSRLSHGYCYLDQVISNLLEFRHVIFTRLTLELEKTFRVPLFAD